MKKGPVITALIILFIAVFTVIGTSSASSNEKSKEQGNSKVLVAEAGDTEQPPEDADRERKAKAERERAKLQKEKEEREKREAAAKKKKEEQNQKNQQNQQNTVKVKTIYVPEDPGPAYEPIVDDRAGIFEIIVTPANAEISIMDELIGKSPVTVARTKGYYPITIKCPGYEDVNLGLIIKPGRKQTIRVILERP